jgi:tetratricopeptide (TPR) repeat protein
MYLDADDVFDADLSEMIEFFGNREVSKSYNSATYQTKDYNNAEKTSWSTRSQARIVRRSSGTRFINKIHETFSVFPLPTYSFNTFAYHSGYIFETEEEKEAKRLRNLNPIMEQVKEKPKDLRALIYLFKGLPQGEEKEAALEKILGIARKKKDSFSETAFLEAVKHYYDTDFQKSLGFANEYLRLFESRRTIILVDICAMKASLLTKLERIPEAIEAYEAYIKYYNMNLINRLDKTPAGTTALIFNDSTHHKLLKARLEELKQS